MVDFAERLRELRTERSLTLKQLSDAVGISIMAISRWENRTRVANINAVIALANFFNVTVGYMVGVEN